MEAPPKFCESFPPFEEGKRLRKRSARVYPFERGKQGRVLPDVGEMLGGGRHDADESEDEELKLRAREPAEEQIGLQQRA